MARRKSAAGDRRRGFVLLEVVVAFAILGLLLSVIWLHMQPRTGPQGLAAWVFEIEAMLREARTTAARSGTDAVISVDTSAHRLQSGARALALPRDVRAGITESACGGGKIIIFRPDGTSCTTVLRIATLSADRLIMVEGVTGDVRIVAP